MISSELNYLIKLDLLRKDNEIVRMTMLAKEAGVSKPSMLQALEKFEKMNMRSIELAKAYKLIEDDLLNKGGENCYKFHNYKINWMNGATHHDQISD